MPSLFWISLVALTALVSRLPQLLSPYFHIDGDECVLGLMAQHIASGRDFPFYFWGQHYGFSWIEAGAAAFAFKFFGIGVYSLKLSMLLLWTTGCVFFYLAIARWTNRMHGFLITSLLILSPAWMAWSMKARGGYITAFLLSSLLLFIFSGELKKRTRWICSGILLGFIFFSQPIFLAGLLPFLFYLLRKQDHWKNVLGCVAGFVGVFILGKLMALWQPNTDFWNPAVFKFSDIGYSVSSLWQRIYAALTQYAGSRLGIVDWASHLIAYLWAMVFVTSLAVYGVRRKNALSTAVLTGIGIILGATFLLGRENYADRYLLSLSVFLIVWFGLQSFQWMQKSMLLKNFTTAVMGVFLILGIYSSLNFKDYYRSDPKSSSEIPEMQKIFKVLEFLNTYGVKYVFSIDDDLSWKISFFSGEKIISRWMNMQARQPAYPVMVNQGYLAGERTVLAGNAEAEKMAFMIVAQEGRTAVVADQYFFQLDPTKDMIVRKMGFAVN